MKGSEMLKLVRKLQKATLSQKSIAGYVITVLVLLFILYPIQSYLQHSSIDQIESDEIKEETISVRNIFEEKFDDLSRAAADWGSWDDLYAYVQDENPNFIRKNVTAESLANLRFDALVILRKSGELIHGCQYTQGQLQALPDEYVQEIKKTGAKLYSPDGARGFIRLGEKIAMVASKPILGSHNDGEPQGELIWVRYLDDSFAQGVGKLTRTSFEIICLQKPELTDEIKQVLSELQSADKDTVSVMIQGDQLISGYCHISSSIGQQQCTLLKASLPRVFFEKTRRYNVMINVGLFTIIVLGLSLQFIHFHRLVLRRLALHVQATDSIIEAADFSLGIPVDGTDEIARLAIEVNTMLDLIQKRQREKEQMYQNMLETEKQQTIGLLASGIAHDFNNILGAMMGFAELGFLKSTEALSQEYFQSILGLTTRAAELIKQIMHFSRQTNVEKKPLQLERLIEQIVRMSERTFKQRVKVQADEIDPSLVVNGDESLFLAMVLNLVINARDAIVGENQPGKEGRIQITAQRVTSQAANDCGQVLITVSDNGPGMDPVTKARIYEPYFTTKKPGEGTGLGLAMAYSTVQIHGGSIECESQLGKGTKFSIKLPLCEQEIVPSRETVEALHLANGKGKILIVDDDGVARQLMANACRFAGYEVIESEDGESALRSFLTNRSSIRLVITDHNMPRMTGHDLCVQIRELNQVPIIVISGYPEHSKRKISGTTFLDKPFKLAELTALIQEVLGGK